MSPPKMHKNVVMNTVFVCVVFGDYFNIRCK
jgi:hypothetical protein